MVVDPVAACSQGWWTWSAHFLTKSQEMLSRSPNPPSTSKTTFSPHLTKLMSRFRPISNRQKIKEPMRKMVSSAPAAFEANKHVLRSFYCIFSDLFLLTSPLDKLTFLMCRLSLFSVFFPPFLWWPSTLIKQTRTICLLMPWSCDLWIDMSSSIIHTQFCISISLSCLSLT